MVELETQDRKQLIALLQYIPELATEAGRKQVLELAGLKVSQRFHLDCESEGGV